MGDASIAVDKQILSNVSSEQIQSMLLMAGHHGSRSSTSSAWLEAVNPSMVVFSAAYRNRYGFPAKQVIERLNSLDGEKRYWFNTACSGALQFEMTESAIKLLQESRKVQRKWYHHQCLENERGLSYQ